MGAQPVIFWFSDECFGIHRHFREALGTGAEGSGLKTVCTQGLSKLAF